MSTTAVLNLGINTRQFHNGLRNAQSDLGSFTKKSIAGFALVGTAIAGSLVVAGASLIKIASDAQETENKFNEVFSGLEKSSNEMAKNLAKNFGLSSRESKKLLGDTGDLLSGFGFAKDSALSFSNQVQELAADLTSFQNFEGGVEGASRAITAALTGETEKMKALGVVIRQGTTEYKNNVKQLMKNKSLTELQAKATENLRIITEQSKNSIGDYGRTSKQLANQLKLTGKIWDDLTVGVGVFLMEVTGAEDATLSFNDSFRSMTDNLLGYLKNWQQNWGILKTWISDNILTIFTVDLPHAVSTWIKNSINNIAVMAKLMGDLFTQFGGWFIGFMARLFTGDLNNAIVKGLQSAFKSMIKWGTDVWDNLVRIFKGDSGGNEFTANLKKGMDVAFGSKGLGETLKKTITDNMKNLKLPLEGFKSAATELKFLKHVPKDLSESADDMSKALKPVETPPVVDDAGELKKGIRTQPKQELQSAVLKGSIEAFKEEKTPQAIVQTKQLKEAKKSNRFLEKISSNQSDTVAGGDW
jgi:hypothetical protein